VVAALASPLIGIGTFAAQARAEGATCQPGIKKAKLSPRLNESAAAAVLAMNVKGSLSGCTGAVEGPEGSLHFASGTFDLTH
jgi:hypothetical protein